MNKIFTLLAAGLLAINSFGQAPEKISYQAIIRDADNSLLVDQAVGMRISVLLGSNTGTVVYSETHNPTTNNNGLVSIQIGNGTSTDNFSSIDWASGSFFIKTETDPTGSTNYTISGTSQLMSVPYALYAEKAGNTFSGDYDDLTNKPVASAFDGDFSSLSNVPTGLGDGDDDTQLTETQVDAFVANNGYLTSTAAEVDGDVTNEIQDLQLVGNNLTITNNGSATTIDLSPYLDDTDTKLTETEVDAFVANNGYLTAELDGSTTNEIQDLQLSGNNLVITNNGFATTIDLSPYLDDTDTKLTEAEVDDFVANNGFLTSELDGSVTNELELPSQAGNVGKFLATNGTIPFWSTTGGITVTTMSANTTLSNGNQIVFINGAVTATFPASPTDGMKLEICTNNTSAGINGNGRTIHLSGAPITSTTFDSVSTTSVMVFYYSSTLDAWFGIY